MAGFMRHRWGGEGRRRGLAGGVAGVVAWPIGGAAVAGAGTGEGGGAANQVSQPVPVVGDAVAVVCG
jgi:hypothetical protein